MTWEGILSFLSSLDTTKGSPPIRLSSGEINKGLPLPYKAKHPSLNQGCPIRRGANSINTPIKMNSAEANKSSRINNSSKRGTHRETD